MTILFYLQPILFIMPDMLNAIVVFSLSAFLIVMGLRFLLKHRRIKRNGQQAKGFVYDMNGKYPVIRFIAKDEQWVTVEHNVSGLYEKGETLNVIYNAANPKEFFINSKKTKLFPFILIGAGIMAIVLGILALLHVIPWHT